MTEYYSAFQKKDSLTRATTWMNFEDLGKIKEARHRRTNTTRFPPHNQTQRDRRWDRVAKGWGRQPGE